jgi:hypothetical protein
MTIGSGDIKLLKSQVNLDTSDGGGAMTAVEVVDGLSNNLFADISELDRTYGRVSLRKTFTAVDTLNVDSYFGAHAIISRLPTDPKVSVSLFSTKNWFDRRDAARNNIESYLARGPKWSGHLLETQLTGQRAIQLAMRISDTEPQVGQGLSLVGNEGLANEYEQYVRVTKTNAVERSFTVSSNSEVVRKVVTVEISDPLRYTFTGPTVSQFEAGTLGQSVCRDTRVANAATYYGAAKLSAGGSLNDTAVTVNSIYTQLVPSAQSETPMTDLTAGGLSALYVPGNTAAISQTLNAAVTPSGKLYIGSSIQPGSFSVNVGGTSAVDSGGEVITTGGTVIGTLDYGRGLILWSASAPAFSGSLPVSFIPAGVPSRVADTASISIVQDTRGYNYTITLKPVPTPGSLQVSYMSQGKVYVLHDSGNGILKGLDAAFGSGVVNFTTGTVLVTTGALPDANSDILFSWSKKVDTFVRSGLAVAPAHVDIQLANPQTTPGSVTATDDGNGNITGHATGIINYASSKVKLVPSTLYTQGTEFSVAYQFGPPNEQRFNMPVRSGTGTVDVVLNNVGGNILPKSVELAWNVDIQDSAALGEIFSTAEQTWNPAPRIFGRDPLVQAFDNGTGGFKKADGTAQAATTINYTTRTLSLSPDFPVAVPKPVWENQVIGTQTTGQSVNGGNLNTTVNTYRRIISRWDMIPTVATMPYDETGYLIVKWRTSAAGTSATEVFTAGALKFDLTPGFAESILQGSVRFTLGGLTYVDRAGSLYHSINPTTGAGTPAGTIQIDSGVAELTAWTPGAANTFVLQSLVTETNVQAVDEVVFRIPITPVRPGSVQLRFIPIDGGEQTFITVGGTGRLDGPNTVGSVDLQTGVARVRFGQKVTVTPAVQAEAYYNADAVFTESSVQKIIKPKPVYADSIMYNAVGYSYLPLSADILGLDPVRLPSDGRVPIYRAGDVVVVNHTDSASFPGTPAIGSTLNVGRVRVSYIKLYDSAGSAIPPTMYAVNEDAGTVTLMATYIQGSLVLPIKAEHRVEDMALVTDVQINGRLTLNRLLSHVFPAGETLVSSALIISDLRARVYGKFSQEAWGNVWSNSLIGNQTTSQYNDTLHPILTTNRGALEEQWALIFTNSTTFRVVGKNIGQIATGDINTPLSPLNPATGQPYFTLTNLGWGTGWSAGNVLRFNTAGANFPLWLARTVLQGAGAALSDSFQVQIRGDIDR